MPYRVYEPQIQPTALKGAYGQSWRRAHGLVKDYYSNVAKQGVKLRFPSYASSDALGAIGDERQIDRGQNETDAQYAPRVRTAWDAWYWGGTAGGILKALSAMGYTAVVPQVRQNAYSLDGSGNVVVTALGGTGWFIDTSSSFWSKFSVLFVQPLPTWWLAGGLTSVFHGGTGTGVVTASGTPTADERVLVWITTGGLVGTAQFKYSLDNGQTFSSAITTAASYSIPSTPLGLGFSGTFTQNDTYSFAPTFNVPADGSAESLRIKSVVKRWQGAQATLSRYVIHTSGFILGWPTTNKLGAPPTGGTAGGAPIYLGGSTTTTWGP